MKIKNLLKEPLLHFFVLGLFLFVLYAVVNDDSGRSAEEIVIDEARLSNLVASFEKTWQRPPTDDETQNLIDAWVREEVFYREGIAIGFDQGDPIIRRRVAQKMSFVADGVVPDTPTDAELQEFLSANSSDYRIPAIYSLQQVYIDPQRHPQDLQEYSDDVHAQLLAGTDSGSLGDSTLLPAVTSSASTVDLRRAVGSDFVKELEGLISGEWQGPVRSGYGIHFVKIDEFVAAREPQLEEVRAAVSRDLLSEKTVEISEAFYAALLERYTVRIEVTESND